MTQLFYHSNACTVIFTGKYNYACARTHARQARPLWPLMRTATDRGGRATGSLASHAHVWLFNIGAKKVSIVKAES